MKMEQVALVVGLGGKMRRVATHWAAVDDALPPEHPLVLLSDMNSDDFDRLAQRLAGLEAAVTAAEVKLRVTRGAYEQRKREVHRWLRQINSWMRGNYRGTDCFALVRRVPGLGQSYQHWWDATLGALVMWKLVIEEPPGPPEAPLTLAGGRTVGQFENLVKAFKAAEWAISPAEVKLQIARSRLRRAQAEATALLMAYGHGVRARLGQEGELVRSIPQLWPKHGPKPGRVSASGRRSRALEK